MSSIKHHITSDLMAAYVAGSLPHPFAMVVAAHTSLCPECRAEMEAQHAAGGLVLEGLNEAELGADLKASVLALLDQDGVPDDVTLPPSRMGIYPGPVAQALGNKPPRWRSVGLGTRQIILHSGSEGTVRLLHIPAGQAVPDHGHNGLELTLVLQGSFEDEEGAFGVGDVEIADQDVDHTPIAGAGEPCICLAATDAPLRFNEWLPRMLQPILRI